MRRPNGFSSKLRVESDMRSYLRQLANGSRREKGLKGFKCAPGLGARGSPRSVLGSVEGQELGSKIGKVRLELKRVM